MPAFKPNPNAALWQKLTLAEEDRLTHPLALPWKGDYRWFRSSNVVDLQNYRSPAEKERICVNLLRVYRPMGKPE